ncbi:unnamed protein product, partial [Didymodactylos carnosus]
MASSASTSKCQFNTECKKSGIALCDGCKSKFCTEHFVQHRQKLNNDYQSVLTDRDLLRQHFNSPMLDDANHELFKQLNEWQVEMTEQIEHTVENGRKMLLQAINDNRIKICEVFGQLSEDLRICSENDSYYEEDIKRFAQQLKQLETEYSTSTNIHLKFQPVDLKRTIKVEDDHKQQPNESITREVVAVQVSLPAPISKKPLFNSLSIFREMPKSTINTASEYLSASGEQILNSEYINNWLIGETREAENYHTLKLLNKQGQVVDIDVVYGKVIHTASLMGENTMVIAVTRT